MNEKEVKTIESWTHQRAIADIGGILRATANRGKSGIRQGYIKVVDPREVYLVANNLGLAQRLSEPRAFNVLSSGLWHLKENSASNLEYMNFLERILSGWDFLREVPTSEITLALSIYSDFRAIADTLALYPAEYAGRLMRLVVAREIISLVSTIEGRDILDVRSALAYHDKMFSVLQLLNFPFKSTEREGKEFEDDETFNSRMALLQYYRDLLFVLKGEDQEVKRRFALRDGEIGFEATLDLLFKKLPAEIVEALEQIGVGIEPRGTFARLKSIEDMVEEPRDLLGVTFAVSSEEMCRISEIIGGQDFPLELGSNVTISEQALVEAETQSLIAGRGGYKPLVLWGAWKEGEREYPVEIQFHSTEAAVYRLNPSLLQAMTYLGEELGGDFGEHVSVASWAARFIARASWPPSGQVTAFAIADALRLVDALALAGAKGGKGSWLEVQKAAWRVTRDALHFIRHGQVSSRGAAIVKAVEGAGNALSQEAINNLLQPYILSGEIIVSELPETLRRAVVETQHRVRNI